MAWRLLKPPVSNPLTLRLSPSFQQAPPPSNPFKTLSATFNPNTASLEQLQGFFHRQQPPLLLSAKPALLWPAAGHSSPSASTAPFFSSAPFLQAAGEPLLPAQPPAQNPAQNSNWKVLLLDTKGSRSVRFQRQFSLSNNSKTQLRCTLTYTLNWLGQLVVQGTLTASEPVAFVFFLPLCFKVQQTASNLAAPASPFFKLHPSHSLTAPAFEKHQKQPFTLACPTGKRSPLGGQQHLFSNSLVFFKQAKRPPLRLRPQLSFALSNPGSGATPPKVHLSATPLGLRLRLLPISNSNSALMQVAPADFALKNPAQTPDPLGFSPLTLKKRAPTQPPYGFMQLYSFQSH